MATHSGVQIALGRLFGIPSSRLQRIARELNYANLCQSTGRGRHPANLTGADIFAYALPIITHLPTKDIGRSLGTVLKMPVGQLSCESHTGAGQDENPPVRAFTSIDRTFGDVVGQLIDGDLQSAFGFADDSKIVIEVDMLRLQATVRTHDQGGVLAISFSSPMTESRQDPFLSWQTTHITKRLMNRLAMISKLP
ncbi:MAG: hypothetical protein KJ834_13230 [Alphaproteobacteria bacterium]|nr:hypothetical protein [Alphaproteobacteria bacterium]